MASGKSFLLALLCAGLGLVFVPAAHAQESIWSALVLGSNEEHPKQEAPALEKYSVKLRNIFGYNQYELLGQHLEMMNTAYEHWLIPRKDFFLRVDSKKAEKPGFFRIKMDLYQETKLLAQLEARVAGQNLFFIRGPYVDKGQIIIILMVK